MKNRLGSKNLFVCLGRPGYQQMVLDFLHQLSRAYPEVSIHGIFDFDLENSDRPKNLSIDYIYKENFVYQGHKGALGAMNAKISVLENENFDHVYYLDSLIWGGWLTTAFEDDVMHTISLSGFLGLAQKYRYLLDIFECTIPPAQEAFSHVRTIKEFFEKSRLGIKCLWVDTPESDFESKIFSPQQFLLTTKAPQDVSDPELQGLMGLWKNGGYRGSPIPVLNSEFNFFEVINNGYTNEVISSEGIHQEFNFCLKVIDTFFSDSRYPLKDMHFVFSATTRLQKITQGMISSLNQKRNVFHGFRGQYLDLQIGNTILEGFHKTFRAPETDQSLLDSLLVFDNYITQQIENLNLYERPQKRRRTS